MRDNREQYGTETTKKKKEISVVAVEEFQALANVAAALGSSWELSPESLSVSRWHKRRASADFPVPSRLATPLNVEGR